MKMFEEIAFNLIELGHSPEAIVGYEITYLLGYAFKKMERNEQMRQVQKPGKDGWTTTGNKRTKTMTSKQILAKARAKKDK